MRTSSVKSVISALMIAVTLAIAVPVAYARPASPTRGRGEGIVTAIVNLLKKFGRIAVSGGPSIPLTGKDEGPEEPEPAPASTTTTP